MRDRPAPSYLQDFIDGAVTAFAVVAGAQPPTPPKLKIQVTKSGLRLYVSGARDNTRIAGYVISRNSRGYKAARQTAVVLPLRAGGYLVRARGTSGNASVASKAVTIVRTADKRPPSS